MATSLLNGRPAENLADLIRGLGVSPYRICLRPPPGRATIEDLIRINDRQQHVYELADRTLIAKHKDLPDSYVAMLVTCHVGAFVHAQRIGFVLGRGGTLQIMPGLVRAPDVSFIRREKFPAGKFPRVAVPSLVPDLAIEVLSKSNRRGEMRRKLREYFESGVSLVWYVDPATETAEAFTSVDDSIKLTKDQSLDGGNVLPGFKLSLADIFADLAPLTKRGKARRKKR